MSSALCTSSAELTAHSIDLHDHIAALDSDLVRETFADVVNHGASWRPDSALCTNRRRERHELELLTTATFGGAHLRQVGDVDVDASNRGRPR